MKKRIVSLFLAAVLLVSLLPSVLPMAGAEKAPTSGKAASAAGKEEPDRAGQGELKPDVFDDKEITELALNAELSLSFDENTNNLVLRFVPAETRWYQLTSTGTRDPWCELYDDQGDYVSGNDDVNGDRNFCLRRKLEAGRAYYYWVFCYTEEPTAISVLLTEFTLPVSGTCGENLFWNLNEEAGILTIEGSGPMYDMENQEAPWYDSHELIAEILLPDGLTKIGVSAFQDFINLAAVLIPEGVECIDDYGFFGCIQLQSVTIPASVTKIGADVFSYCDSLEEIQTAEGNPAYCSQDGVLFNKEQTELLQYPGGKQGAYEVPEGVERIGTDAFSGALSLSGVTFCDSVTEIGASAFSNCINMETAEFGAGLETLKRDAFYNCIHLKSVTLPVSVKRIGDCAFGNCTALESVKILSRTCAISQDGMTLGDYNCTVIYGGRDSTAQAYAETYDYNFVEIDLCEYGSHNYTLDSQLVHTDTEAGWKDWVCADCGHNYRETIPAGHVYTCTGYTELWYGNMQCIYCDDSYEEDASVEMDLNTERTVNLTEELQTAWLRFTPEHDGTYLFRALEGYDPWCYIYSASGFEIGYDDDGGGKLLFRLLINLAGETTYYYKVGCFGEYPNDVVVELTEYEIPSEGVCGNDLTWSLDKDTGLLTITGSGPMYDWNNGGAPWYDSRLQIFAVSLPDGLTSIGANAFFDCGNLKTITIPANVAEIGEAAFRFCQNMTEILVEEASHSFCSQDGVLFNKDKTELLLCPSAKEGPYEIPQTVKTIGASAFLGCYGMKQITIPDGVTEIGPEAFSYSGLTSLVLPDSVTTIWQRMAAECWSLESIRFPAELGYIPSWACEDCINLTQVELPTKPAYIGEFAFYACGGLKKITLPQTVTEIGNYAFAYCDGLETVRLPKYLEDVYEFAFLNCDMLTDVTIPASVTFIGESAFGYTWDGMSSDLGKVGNFTIRGFTGTQAENYAETNEFIFIPLKSFSDVPVSAYYYDAVLWAVANGVTSGTSNKKFSPDMTCTREQVVTFLWKAVGSPEPETTANPFPKDVDPSQYYYKAVLWAKENGVTGGVGKNKFGVGQACTREQVVTFLWKAVGSPEPETTTNPFPKDVDPSQYYYKAVLWAKENGVTGGVGKNKFGVGQSCTRAQIVTFLYKAVG